MYSLNQLLDYRSEEQSETELLSRIVPTCSVTSCIHFDQELVCRHSQVLDSKKFSSAKNFVKSDRPAVRQEFIFAKRRSSLVALRSFGRCFVAYR